MLIFDLVCHAFPIKLVDLCLSNIDCGHTRAQVRELTCGDLHHHSLLEQAVIWYNGVLYCDMQMIRQACTLCANSHNYTLRQSIVVKDESPRINKLLYKSRNDIKLIFIISARSFLVRKYLSFICLWFPVHIAVVCMRFFAFNLQSDLHLCALSACSKEQRHAHLTSHL